MTKMVDYADRKEPELLMAAVGVEKGKPLPKQHERKGYALNQRESALVLKVKEILDAAMRPKFQETEDGHFIAVIDEEVKTAAVEMCRKEKPPVDWRKALQVANRVLAGDWFSLVHTAVETDYGQMSMDELSLTEVCADVPLFMLYLLRTSRGYNGIVLPEEFPDFYFKATTLTERRKALGLTNRFKYISLQELAAVKTVQAVCTDLDRVLPGNRYYSIPSNNVSNALANIGRRAVETKKVHGGRSQLVEVKNEERGISLFHSLEAEKVVNLLSPGAARLLDLVDKFVCETGYTTNLVAISVTEYMKLRGISDRKSATEKLRKEAEALYELSAEHRNESGGFDKARYFERSAYEPYAGAVFQLSSSYLSYLQARSDWQPMLMPDSFFKLPDRGSDYFLARKICEHYRSNITSSNACSISVKKLLAVSNIISYEALADKGQASQRIIKPFTEAMDRIADTGEIDWEFAYGSRSGKSGPLSSSDLDLVYRDYEVFSSMMIHITWLNEPNYTGLKEGKAKRLAAANEPKKRRGRPRKQPQE